jgi:uncharacterized protein
VTARPWSAAPGGVRVAVRLTPKASRDRVDGPAPEADGGVVLKASVTAVPEDGKANAALIKLLSKEWRVPKSAIDIVQGATDRRKVLFLSGDSDELVGRLDQWMATRK